MSKSVRPASALVLSWFGGKGITLGISCDNPVEIETFPRPVMRHGDHQIQIMPIRSLTPLTDHKEYRRQQ